MTPFMLFKKVTRLNVKNFFLLNYIYGNKNLFAFKKSNYTESLNNKKQLKLTIILLFLRYT